MPKCSNCKFGEWEWQDYGCPGMYHCLLFDEWLDEKDAENDDLPCDGFVHDEHDLHNNSTKRA